MTIASKVRVVAGAISVLTLLCSAGATTIPFGFTASLDTGSLAGTHFSGSGSYDNQSATGLGQEYLSLTSLAFSVAGQSFTRSQISQGGQVILNNGVLTDFTAAFFPTSGPFDDFALGFGGPGIIGYSVPPGFNPGVGSYVLQTFVPAPEPSELVLCGGGSVGVLLLLCRRRSQEVPG